MTNQFFLAMILLSMIPFLIGKPATIDADGVVVVLLIDQFAKQESISSLKKGFTFIKVAHYPEFGIDFMSCGYENSPNGGKCDPYQGDTLCTERRPLLCTKQDDTPRPPYYVYGSGAAMLPYYYFGWNRGHIATTTPVQGSQFATVADADRFCADSFGAGWRISEFHDGYAINGMNGTTYAGDQWTQNAASQGYGGWNFYSYGNIRNDTRFWIHITDQPSTCWAK